MALSVRRRDIIIATMLTALPLGAAAQGQRDVRDSGAARSILVVIDLKVRPESIGEAREMLLAGLPLIRAFDGCRDAAMHVNQDDEYNVLFIEHWASRQHYERYRAWRVERGDNARLVSMLVEPLTVRAFEVVE